ncbi:MAG: GIY-YIG nuclease family protein, partial [Anaerolineae bacterium]|nr:GIY-YIG nuclease family protein [Anaerolineae bacterium]
MSAVGSYVLVLPVPSEAILKIGKLGLCVFPPGYYCYAGSARGPGGLPARLARHLRKGKKLRWHIDYLLEQATIVEIWQAPSAERLECRWARAVLALPGVESSIAGFGSSDCDC